MTNDEIKEAIGYISGMIRHPAYNNLSETAIGYLKSLLALAEEYLKVEGWPEEQSVNPNKMVNIWAEGFNEALHICKLAAMKEKNRVNREQIEESLNLVFSDYALNGQGNRNLTTNLADALLELINGKEA